MTKLGSLTQAAVTLSFGNVNAQVYNIVTGQAAPLDLDSLTASIFGITAQLGNRDTLLASFAAWTNQDDDAHEPCSLTACRHPLHPGPCKGWKGTLHSVAPGTYHQLEGERVRKANERRLKRIADLKAANKPIPRSLLQEIKPKAPPTKQVAAVPAGQVGQKADLAGGQAHQASQAISNAAGITPKVPLPLGPKAKKPTVAGRGPAFVITQPKVTDQYKLDKAAKITPQEWASLSAADKNAIRNELTAIKARGFGPQQTKADALLAKLPAPSSLGNLKPGTPGTITTPKGNVHQVINLPPQTPSAAPGKTTLGKATKTVPTAAPNAPSAPASGAIGGTKMTPTRLTGQIRANGHADVIVKGKKIRVGFANGGQDGTLTMAPGGGYTITEKDGTKHQFAKGQLIEVAPATPGPAKTGNTVTDQVKKIMDPAAGMSLPARAFTYNKMTKADFDSLDDATQTKVLADLDSILNGGTASQTTQRAAKEMKDRFDPKAGGTLKKTGLTQRQVDKAKAAVAAKATPPVVKPMTEPAKTPAATPKALSPDAQHARAVAGRATGRPTSKAHVDAYGKLSKADFDSLDATTQRTIRDDLANAKAKFLDPAKQKAAQDLLDRFGNKHTSPAPASSPAAAPPAAVKKLPMGHQATLEKIASGAKVVSIGNGHANPGLKDLDRQGLVEWDPAAKQFKLTDAGRAHLPKQGGGPAGVPAHPKGYSDPQQQAMKAVHGSDTDDTLKRVGALSPTAVKGLDDGDRRTLLSRLAFIATHPKATPQQKERAVAYGRIINKGPASDPGKLDHEPSLGELHAHEQKSGAAQKLKDAEATADALKAANPSSGLPAAARITAMAALSKTQFDALSDDDRRKILDALQSLHLDKTNNSYTPDKAVGDAITKLTGHEPGVQRLKAAEEDFRAGRASGDAVHDAFITARVQAHDYGQVGRDAVEAEAARIARDNPTLPLYARARLVGEPKYGNSTYHAITLTQNKFNWEAAPRLTQGDMESLFRPTQADLKQADPIHAEAVNALRQHVIATGLSPASSWSTPTKEALVRSMLGIKYGTPEPSKERIQEFFDLPPGSRILARQVVQKQLDSRLNDHGKTETWITLRAMEGKPELQGELRDAVYAAVDSHASPGDDDIYRKLPPGDFQSLPTFTRNAINKHLDQFQTQAERGGPVGTFTAQSNALKDFPAALKAQLNGDRTPYVDRSVRNAADVAKYGQNIVTPADRVDIYRAVPIGKFRTMRQDDQDKIHADLDKIANNSANPLALRYTALRTKDIELGDATGLNGHQITAIVESNPSLPGTVAMTRSALMALSKSDYDGLDKVYRDAIDQRVLAMQATDPMAAQVLGVKFHPNTPAAANPSGLKPTPAASVQPHVQDALDTIYGTHPKSHTMAHQLKTYGALRGNDFQQLNPQEQSHLLSDLSYIETTAKGPSKTKAKLLIDRFTPAGTPAGQIPPQPAIPPANSVSGQVRYPTPLKGTLVQAANKGVSGDGWTTTPGGRRVWGKYGAAGLLLMHQDPATGERRYLMVQRGPSISDPGKWQFPGGAIDSKENFHQGGTREVIEELGFKADALKDAEVHGEHSSGVPGSTWKYVSIAAQVPQMLKPDLSSYHARQETSDAKWMTEAEIKALDTSGKLLAPLAGGKLEQNVISLFPAVTPVKLGQVVRPAPVTKRQGRLRMPPGGRQAPATFNAWPYPHKKSTGKDLMADNTARDKLRQDVKHARKAYDGKTGDGRLAAIGAMQGFDDTPTVVSKSEIDRLLATGDYIEAWRGVKRPWGGSKTAADINEDFRSGPAWYGRGIFGNGYYLATQKRVAEQYADGSKNSVVRMLIPKSAVIEHYKKVQTEARKNPRTSKAKGVYGEDGTLYDAGRWAAAKGIDGIQINHDTTNDTGGWARHIAKPGLPAFNWINRAVLIVQEADK